jgi:hypothetical protein
MNFKWIGYVLALLLVVLVVVFGLEIRNVLRLEENGLATRAVCESLIEFVEKEKRWPDSWEELTISPQKHGYYKTRVNVEFRQQLKEVARSMSNGEAVVTPRDRALNSYLTAYEVLRKTVSEVAKRQNNMTESELR